MVTTIKRKGRSVDKDDDQDDAEESLYPEVPDSKNESSISGRIRQAVKKEQSLVDLSPKIDDNDEDDDEEFPVKRARAGGGGGGKGRALMPEDVGAAGDWIGGVLREGEIFTTIECYLGNSTVSQSSVSPLRTF